MQSPLFSLRRYALDTQEKQKGELPQLIYIHLLCPMKTFFRMNYMTVSDNNASTNKFNPSVGQQQQQQPISSSNYSSSASPSTSSPTVQFVVAKEMWIYFCTTVPMLLLTVALYAWFERRRVQREQRRRQGSFS